MSHLITADLAVRFTPQARIIAAILAVAFMAMILELIRQHKLQERYSVIWFIAGIGMLVGAAFPGILELLARVMGVRDVGIALFSIVLLVLLALALSFSVIISRQAEQITRLAQEDAIQRARVDAEADALRRDDEIGSNGDAAEGALEPEEERLEG